MTENELSRLILNLCIKIHKALGPGLLESAYEDCLEYELAKAGHKPKRQMPEGHARGTGQWHQLKLRI